MEFKVGDIVRRREEHLGGNWPHYCTYDFNPKKEPKGVFKVKEVSSNGGIRLEDSTDSFKYTYSHFELVTEAKEENFIKNKKMEKKIYEVLTANKKTGETKKEIVVADDEQSAILKAFGVDAENTYIKVKEEGKYTEEKPVQAVIVKEDKKWGDTKHLIYLNFYFLI